MNLYLDASALVRRYVAEPGSDLVREAMANAERWIICRIGYVEVNRAIELVAGTTAPALRRFRAEWRQLAVIEVDEQLTQDAAALARRHGLRTLDAFHLASAVTLDERESAVATWDKRLWTAARDHGIEVLPESL